MRPTRTIALRWALACSMAASISISGACLGAAEPPPRALDGRAIVERSYEALYYPGHDMRAKVTMELGTGGEVRRLRVMTMLRLNTASGGEQKYLLYFHKPGDVRRMSCMVWKHVGQPDDRWMFVPASGRVLRVEAPERSSFLGSDFVREEFSGRDVDADDHRLLRTEKVMGRDCYVVESVPRKIEDFTKCVSWIDQSTFLPLRQEFWDEQGERSRTFTAGRIEAIPSKSRAGRVYSTLMERSMTDVSGRWTRVTLDSVAYDLGLHEDDFSNAHMQTAVSAWLP
jgi:outer membrane lipoprotein-sorting protein